MADSTPLRAKLRGVLLSGNSRRSKTLDLLINGETVQVDIKEPSIQERDQIFDAGGIDISKGKVGEDGKVSGVSISKPFNMNIEACLLCAYVPMTGERMFVEADRADFLGQPASQANAGGWIMAIGSAVMDLLNSDDAKKNSPTTPTSSSSSASPSAPDAGTSTPSDLHSPSAS